MWASVRSSSYCYSRLNFSRGSIVGAAINLAVTTIGAGMLTLPSAFADAGILFALLLIVIIGIFTVASVDFMVLSIEKMGLNSYEELTLELLGRWSEEIVRWILIIYNVGSAVGYLVIIGDLFEPLQPYITEFIPFLVTERHTLFFFWLLIMLPLSCVRSLHSLQGTSFFAIFATCFIAIMVIFRYYWPLSLSESESLKSSANAFYLQMSNNNNNKNSNNFGNNNLINSNEYAEHYKTYSYNGNKYSVQTLSSHSLSMSSSSSSESNSFFTVNWWLGRRPILAIPVFMFSFDCQSLVFQIYAGLDDMCRVNMMYVATISILLSGTLHAAVGLYGYLSNPSNVRDNIMNNYDPNTDVLFAIAYALYAVPINLAYILMLFPIRDSIFILWYGYSSASVATHVPRKKDFVRLVRAEDELNEMKALAPSNESIYMEEELHQLLIVKRNRRNSAESISLRDHLIVSLTLSTVCIALALIVPGIVGVVSLLGSGCSSVLCFIVPALYRWQLHRTGVAFYTSRMERAMVLSMLLCGIFGITFGSFTSVKALFEWSRNTSVQMILKQVINCLQNS